jgi:hypothetical protein
MTRRAQLGPGRKVICNACLQWTVQGASRVMRKMLFFFCPTCWSDRRACEVLMDRLSKGGNQ